MLLADRPHLACAALPFSLGGAPFELLRLRATDDDPAALFARQLLLRVIELIDSPAKEKRRSRRRSR